MNQVTPEEAKQWVEECGAEHRAETMQALFDGNEVATHWASKVLAAQDIIEVLLAEIEHLRGALKRCVTDQQSYGHMRRVALAALNGEKIP